MARKQIVRKFSFAFLGKGWEDGYINFKTFSLSDIANNISPNVDPKNPNPIEVKKSLNEMIALLEDKFVDGKYPTDEGGLEDIKKEELATMPNDILQGAMNFLSQSETSSSVQPSELSSPQTTP